MVRIANNSQYYGPGFWYFLHLISANVETENDKISVMYCIKIAKEKLFCEKCRKHFCQFVEKNPPEKYLYKKNGLFLWTCKAHNNANLITGKKKFSRQEIINLYYELKKSNLQ